MDPAPRSGTVATSCTRLALSTVHATSVLNIGCARRKEADELPPARRRR